MKTKKLTNELTDNELDDVVGDAGAKYYYIHIADKKEEIDEVPSHCSGLRSRTCR